MVSTRENQQIMGTNAEKSPPYHTKGERSKKIH